MPELVVVVPHTHWDREWYLPAAALQLRLGRLIDAVAALLDSEPSIPSFLLDGQAIILDDYAAVREHGAAMLSRLLRAGRLECGPWYVLPDELLVSAEALVRNLLAGRRTVTRFGGTPLAVGYTPDAFGHSGALPAILRGFGIGAAVAWRGVVGSGDSDLARWQSADGSEVLLIHLPAPGYEYGANLPAGDVAAAGRWHELERLLGARSRCGVWLVLNGADHHAPQAALAESVAALARASGNAVRLGGLAEFASLATAAASDAELPLFTGEQRATSPHAWALQDTHGSRIYLKQWNAWCQRMLERVAEPLAALALLAGTDLREELRAAWRSLLENHPHDSICGTSADEVHREMMTRFRRCAAQGREAVARSLDAVLGRDPDAVRIAGRDAWRPALAVFNPVPRSRAALVEADVALPIEPLGAGPGSQRASASPRRPGLMVNTGTDGAVLETQELERREGTFRTDSPRHYPLAERVEWRRVLVRVPELPPLGVAVLGVSDGWPSTTAPPVADTGPARATEFGLENGRLWVRVESDGTFAVADRATGISCHGLGAIHDEPDAGDSYTSSIAAGHEAALVPDAVAVSVIHEGPLRAALEVSRRYEASALEITMRVGLDAGAGLVTLLLSGVNRRHDHRLRIAFPLGEAAQRVVADGHFGPVERAAGALPAPPGSLEIPAGTAPMQRWVALGGAGQGLIAISDGLPQYEARPDGTLLITLVRAFGELSKRGLPERPGNAGWPVRTPDAQCRGPFTARLALAPCLPVIPGQPGVIEGLADEFLATPWAVMLRGALALPGAVAGASLEGEGLVMSAAKPPEAGRGIVLRCYNTLQEPVRGRWSLAWPARLAERCRLDETPTGDLALRDGIVEFEAAPREIVTIRLR